MVLRIVLVLVGALTLQTSLVVDLRVVGASGDLVLLLAVAGGLSGGPERGAVLGFAAGLAYDLLLVTPFGLSALAYCLTGYAAGAMQGSVLRAAAWIPMASALVASAVGVVGFALIGEVIGQEGLVGTDLVPVVGVVSVLNALLAPAGMRVVGWAQVEAPSRPVGIRR